MGSNVNLTYYQGNKEQIKNKAKEYYEKNKEWLPIKAREKYETLSEDQIKNMYHSRTDEQTKKRNAYMKSWYANLSDSKRDIIRNRSKNRYYA